MLREDLPLPLAVLKDTALSHNGHWMRRFLAASRAEIAPHGKTTMSPQLFGRQLDDGAFAITIASVQQLQVARHYGFDRVLLANQLVGSRSIRYVLDEINRDPAFDFYCLVDSVALVRRLAEAARHAELRRPLQLIVEGGFQGGRTGCRQLAEALAVAAAVKAASRSCRSAASEAMKGCSREQRLPRAKGWSTIFSTISTTIAVACEPGESFGSGTVMLTAGGSSFYDLVARRFAKAQVTRAFMVLTRSGCYLTHDSGRICRPIRRAAQALAGGR